MRRLKWFLFGLTAAIAAGVLAATFNTFSPNTGLMVGNANSPTTTLAVGTDVTAVFTNTCDATKFLRGDGSCQVFSTPANPSGLIGLTAVNGVAATFDRSDSTHALDQSIVPTWTGAHTFTPSSAVIAATINARVNTVGLSVVGGTNTANTFAETIATGTATGFSSGLRINGGTNASDFAAQVNNASAGANFLQIFGDGHGTLGPTATAGVQWTTTGATTINATSGAPLTVKANGTTIFIANSTTSPTVVGFGPTAASTVNMTPDSSSFTITYTGMTTTVTGTALWRQMGNLVCLRLPVATGTSNSTAFTGTGLPAAIQPANSQMLAPGPFTFEDNTLNINTATVQVSATGTVTFLNNGSVTGWTAAGTKGVNQGGPTVCYFLTYFWLLAIMCRNETLPKMRLRLPAVRLFARPGRHDRGARVLQ